MQTPNSVRHLDNAIRRIAGIENYMSARTLIANAIVAHLLPNGVVKGGSSLKLRYGDKATRFTTDLDTVRTAEIEQFIADLSTSLEEGWGNFTGRVVTERKAHPKDVPVQYVMQPLSVKLSYMQKPWCSVLLEVGHNEIGDADAPDYVIPTEANNLLKQLGLDVLPAIPLMPLEFQIAQKLHGLSESGSNRINDLIDLQLIVANSDVDLQNVNSVCKRLFNYRNQQTWPPAVVKTDAWSEMYENQAENVDVEQDLDSAITWVNKFIESIENA
jgi:hypothetical protein